MQRLISALPGSAAWVGRAWTRDRNLHYPEIAPKLKLTHATCLVTGITLWETLIHNSGRKNQPLTFQKEPLRPIKTREGGFGHSGFSYCRGREVRGRLTRRRPRARTPTPRPPPGPARSRCQVGGPGSTGPSRGRACQPQPLPPRLPLCPPRGRPLPARGVCELPGGGSEEGLGGAGRSGAGG